jgi:hypothetical protein
MELKVELQNFSINDYGDTIASLIADEVRTAVRTMVRSEVKAQQANIKKLITKNVTLLLDAMDEAAIKKLI